MPLADMGISNCGAIFADLVSGPRNPEAFAGNIPLPAGGSAAGERLRSLADRPDRLNGGIPQGYTPVSQVAIRDGGDLRCRECHGDMVVSERNRRESRRGGVYAERTAEQPYGRSKRDSSGACCVGP